MSNLYPTYEKMNYPTYEKYKVLYTKYLNKDRRNQLLELAGDLKNKYILELCGGSGDLSLEAFKRGAKEVVMIDKSQEMLNPKFKNKVYNNRYIGYFEYDIEDFFRYTGDYKFNTVFCCQAINYWFNKDLIKKLSEIMYSGGLFIFNTFNTKPSTNPIHKEYKLKGKNYLEVSYLVGKTIYHIQSVNGLSPHFTNFKYISRKEFVDILSPYFYIEKIIDGRTDIYRCEKL